MISLFQLWNLDDWDQRISFIFKGNFIGWKYLGFCFGFFYKFQTINFCIFSTKMDWDIIIRQLDFFFSPSEHHRVHIQLCDVHANFVNTFFCFVCEHIHFMWKSWWSISNTGIFNTTTHSKINVKCEYT